MWIFEAQRSLCNCLYCWQFIQQQECFFSVWQQASQNVGSVSSGPSDTVLVRSAEVRTSSSYQDSSGSISSVEGRSSHPETKNCSSPEPERRLCFHISLVVILGTSWYRFFFCWEKTSNRRRRKKNKDHRCLQAEARQSGPWIRGVQCAELQMMQPYTVFDIALTMHHTGLTGRQRNRRKVRINTHTHVVAASV